MTRAPLAFDSDGDPAMPWSCSRSSPSWPRAPQFWKQLEADWQAVLRSSTDARSHSRLVHLRRRLATTHYGVRESAIAELTVAGKLLRTGGRVTWLPESQTRTADIECLVNGGPFFVEVTAMIGAFRQTHGIPRHRALFLHHPDGPVTDGDVLIHRMLARISQKACQLSDYRAPVVLALSVPPQEEDAVCTPRSTVELDLRRLAAAMTGLLLRLTQLSGVVMSLWSVKPLPASSAVRLANVGLVERNRHQAESPQVSLLVGNPGARAPLSREQAAVLRQIL